ncbi:hypothetical protein BGP77_04145 [Saccharospirillum sp. MSK14-1]|uniref:hypothetical protein n=1 Tax=Saccharospirillum sp. MSK14-1 TaxID=1897632 RepID=UPI000D3C0A36|nr:hypothetical protein [Saccharospirillum sp. MSK14-1]PTY36497.1 hypothetical protein BGP77_04145 [Saccharospirillum sp. MSK14-1]
MRKLVPPYAIAVIAAAMFALSTLVLLVMVLANSGQTSQLRAENQQLSQRATHLSKALARFNEDQDDVVTVIEEMEAEIAELRSNYAHLGDTAENARQRLERANERLNRLTQLESEHQAAVRANEELQERNAILIERLATSRADIERLQQALDNQADPVIQLY